MASFLMEIRPKVNWQRRQLPYKRFLPRDAMQSAVMRVSRLSVRLFVCNVQVP